MRPPNIEDVGTGTFQNDGDIFICSIAVSLKRIADAVTGTDVISRAIQEGISQGAQDWIGHMVRSGR